MRYKPGPNLATEGRSNSEAQVIRGPLGASFGDGWAEASSYVTGTVLFVDGGWTAIDGRFTPPI